MFIKRRRNLWILCLVIACMLCGCQKEQETVSETRDDIAAENFTEAVSEIAENPTESEQQIVEDIIPEEYAAALIITINPKIKLYVDSDNVVIGVEYMNEDAKVVAAEIELVNHPLEESVEKLVVAATEPESATSASEMDIWE